VPGLVFDDKPRHSARRELEAPCSQDCVQGAGRLGSQSFSRSGFAFAPRFFTAYLVSCTIDESPIQALLSKGHVLLFDLALD